ncbi:MAG: RNA polymerase sigma factor [Caldilineaceae bacterium]|nr:RNA polymerase sigma factor [Caldilineaceae bacterium]
MEQILSTIEETFRAASGRVLATLISSCHDFDQAEEAMQEAFLVALERWPTAGIPENPAAWITTTARRKLIDRLRRQQTFVRKLAALQAEQESQAIVPSHESEETQAYPDERLELIFTCCHPALAFDAQIALTLRTLGGLTTEEIARAFLTPLPTMAQRLVRAKRKIREAGIPFGTPPSQHQAERIAAVHTVLYLIFNEGYAASAGDSLIRHDLCNEAIRLTRLLAQLLQPTEDGTAQQAPSSPITVAETLGLLALMLLHHARRAARLDSAGELITLEEQDRAQWNATEIEEGIVILDQALLFQQPGPYQIQAAISALHAQAPSAAATDWPQIAALYGALARSQPSPIVELNRAVAIAMAQGPQHGLARLDELGSHGRLDAYHLFHAARADLLRRAEQWSAAALAYQAAIERVENQIERAYLQKRLQQVQQASQRG